MRADTQINNGLRGTPSPTADHTIGPAIDAGGFSFTQARISAREADNNGIDFRFNCTSRGCVTDVGNTAGLGGTNAVVDLSSPAYTFYDDLQTNNYARYCVLDAISRDVGFDANSNQSTLGGACVTSSIGDTSPILGTYVGHGINEGSFEGYYRWSGGAQGSGAYTAFNAITYATWVR